MNDDPESLSPTVIDTLRAQLNFPGFLIIRDEIRGELRFNGEVRKLLGRDRHIAATIVVSLAKDFSETGATKGDIAEVRIKMIHQSSRVISRLFNALWVLGAVLVGIQLVIAGALWWLLS